MANNFVSFTNVDLTDGFFKNRYELNKNVSIISVKNQFEKSGRFNAMRFNYHKTGKAPHIYYDSDVAKWIEAVAYLLLKDRKSMKEEEAFCDALIDAMAMAQRDDGYLNSTHQQMTPDLIFKDRSRHELYCAGHLIEAAIEYHKATGKDKFLKIMEKYCDLIERAFIIEKTAAFVTPGHEEIELALFKLYEHTKNEKYRKMATFFLKMRGIANEPMVRGDNRYYAQDDTDIYNLKEANGHSVRALYLYSAIADLALLENDEKLKENLNTVLDDILYKKMYVTGGLGSTHTTESFTKAYDLPNKTAYSESCCAIAMILFAARMRRLEKNSKYGSVSERVLYNSLLSSTSLDGKSFFYENPLEIALEEYAREVATPEKQRERLPITERVEVFNCSCCPPNINRFFAQLGSFIVFEEKNSLCIEQYISCNAKTAFGTLNIKEDYSTLGKATISCSNYLSDKISIRIPEWSENPKAYLDGDEISINNIDGYADITVKNTFELVLDFGISAKFISSNPSVRANAGRVALTYGPTVYCLEMKDNGNRLNQISIDTVEAENAITLTEDFHGIYSISAPAYRLKPQKALYYLSNADSTEKITAKFIPYYAFANRGKSDMLVWVRKK